MPPEEWVKSYVEVAWLENTRVSNVSIDYQELSPVESICTNTNEALVWTWITDICILYDQGYLEIPSQVKFVYLKLSAAIVTGMEQVSSLSSGAPNQVLSVTSLDQDEYYFGDLDYVIKMSLLAREQVFTPQTITSDPSESTYRIYIKKNEPINYPSMTFQLVLPNVLKHPDATPQVSWKYCYHKCGGA